MVQVLTGIKTRTLFNGDLSKPSPLGWIVLYAATQFFLFMVVPSSPDGLTRTLLSNACLVVGFYIIFSPLPRAVLELRLLALNERPNWEWHLWAGLTHRLSASPTRRRLQGLAAIFVLAGVSLWGVRFFGASAGNWTSIACNSLIQVICVLLMSGQEADF